MKQVTIDSVRERIAELERAERISMISLRAEFELACLRMLVASMDVKPFMYGIADPDGAAHMDECCVSTSMAGIEDYVHMLNEECEEGGPLFTVVPLYTAPPVQVNSVDDDVRSVVALLENNEWAEHCTKTEIGQRLESEITRLVGYVQPAPVASDAEPSLRAMMRALDAFYADGYVPERAMLAAFRILLADVRNQGHQEPAADNTATADELRAQGVDIMKAKTLQSMQRSRSSFDAETWAVAEQCLLGLVDGCEVVANELRTGTLPERFRPQPDDTAPQQFEALATSAGSGKQ